MRLTRLSWFLAMFSALAVPMLAQTPAPVQGMGPAPVPAAGQAAPGAVPGPGRGRGAFPAVVIGPPAPVPPEVRTPPEELARVNDAIRKWTTSDTSPDRALLQKYAPLLLLPAAPRVNTAATYTQTVQRMGPRHEGFVERAKQGGIDLLFAGDSITD